jgi:glucokinase
VTAHDKTLNVGVDLGGTKVALGLVTPEGKCITHKNFPTAADKGSDWIIAHLIEEINTFLEEARVPVDDINSIGIGVPGTVDLATGNVVLAPNIYWQDVPLGQKMKAGFPTIPIHIDQDTNTAVLGEYFLCDDPAVENLFFLTISTGVGSGLILNKTLYRGRLNTAGEIGHTIVEKDGIPCTCGSRGCLQAYAKGPAIADIVVQRIKNGEPSTLEGHIRNGRLTALQVAEAASTGDQVAQDVLRAAAEYVGIALANVVSVLNPDIIIIGGGVAQSGTWFIEKIKDVTKSSCYPPARESFRIELTTNWEKSAIIGAGLLYKTLPAEHL